MAAIGDGISDSDCERISAALSLRQKGDFMLSRILVTWIGWFAFCLNLIVPAASAQDHPTINVFFGFDFILQPISIKWVCGGQRDQDLSQIEALIVAYPEDAERAELQSIVATLSQKANGLESLPLVLDAELTDRQVEQLCAAATQLKIDWVTPEQLVNDEEDGIPAEQRVAWANFYEVAEGFQ